MAVIPCFFSLSPSSFTPGDPWKPSMNIPSASRACALSFHLVIQSVSSLHKRPYLCIWTHKWVDPPSELTQGQETLKAKVWNSGESIGGKLNKFCINCLRVMSGLFLGRMLPCCVCACNRSNVRWPPVMILQSETNDLIFLRLSPTLRCWVETTASSRCWVNKVDY